MISNNTPQYFCASADNPKPATFVCHHAGCKAYPFLCGRSNCACATMHKKHHLQLIGGFLEELTVPPKLPEELTKEIKDVDGIMRSLIESLKGLRQRHQDHVDAHSQGHRKFAGLARKLLNGEQLESREATGDAFASMLAEFDALPAMQSPYPASDEQFQVELREVRGAGDALLASIERLWNIPQPVIFRFSESMKNMEIKVDDEGKRAKSYSIYNDGLVLLDPCLSTSKPSRATFQINQRGDFVGVGICFKDIVSKKTHAYRRLGS